VAGLGAQPCPGRVDQEPAQLGSEPVGTGDPHGRRLRRRRNACCRRGGPNLDGRSRGHGRVIGRSPWVRAERPQRLSGSPAGVRRRSTYDARPRDRSSPLWRGAVCTWSRRARLSAPLARCDRTMTCRSALTTDAACGHRSLPCWARSLVGCSWPPAVTPICPCLTAGHDPAHAGVGADEHGRHSRGRAWHLRGQLPYRQGGHGLGQAQLPGDRLGRSPSRALGDAASDRHGRPSGGRRHRRGDQGTAAGYLGAIDGRLHAVRPQATPRLASTLAAAQGSRSPNPWLQGSWGGTATIADPLLGRSAAVHPIQRRDVWIGRQP
jgi:hypothetical protein